MHLFGNPAVKVTVPHVQMVLRVLCKMENSLSQQGSLSLPDLVWGDSLNTGTCPCLKNDLVQSSLQAPHKSAHEESHMVIKYCTTINQPLLPA